MQNTQEQVLITALLKNACLTQIGLTVNNLNIVRPKLLINKLGGYAPSKLL